MTTRKVTCISCRGRGSIDTGIVVLRCNHCKGTGSISEPIFEFTLIDLKSFYRVLKHQYIDQADIDAISAVNKLMKYIELNEK